MVVNAWLGMFRWIIRWIIRSTTAQLTPSPLHIYWYCMSLPVFIALIAVCCCMRLCKPGPMLSTHVYTCQTWSDASSVCRVQQTQEGQSNK